MAAQPQLCADAHELEYEPHDMRKCIIVVHSQKLGEPLSEEHRSGPEHVELQRCKYLKLLLDEVLDRQVCLWDQGQDKLEARVEGLLQLGGNKEGGDCDTGRVGLFLGVGRSVPVKNTYCGEQRLLPVIFMLM